MKLARVMAAAGICLWALPCPGHQLQVDRSRAEAVVLTMTYPDGSPFAYESYELFSANRELPVQVGRTDADGRVVFIPSTQTEWRIKAFSEDGHGVEQRFQVQAQATESGSEPTGAWSRVSALITGVGVLLGLFGFHQLFSRRGNKNEE